jgi:hypothetical protein
MAYFVHNQADQVHLPDDYRSGSLPRHFSGPFDFGRFGFYFSFYFSCWRGAGHHVN